MVVNEKNNRILSKPLRKVKERTRSCKVDIMYTGCVRSDRPKILPAIWDQLRALEQMCLNKLLFVSEIQGVNMY